MKEDKTHADHPDGELMYEGFENAHSELVGKNSAFSTGLYLSNIASLLLVVLYFIGIEFLQFKKDPKDYFGSFWNFTDLT